MTNSVWWDVVIIWGFIITPAMIPISRAIGRRLNRLYPIVEDDE